ncbi:MAG: phenylacetate-CoA ligase [Gammaproteobacteria bacterium]|jgi:phenylacetate-CoA ligase
MSDFYDSLETRDPEQRESDLFAALPGQLANAQARTEYFRTLLEGVDPDQITSRESLAALPVTRKAEVSSLQKNSPPFGGLAASALGEMARVFASPGSMFEAQPHRADYWRCARALFAAGFRRGDLVHNTFSYHFTPAGAMIEAAAHALGCAVFPAGGGQSELQVNAITHFRPSGYTGTPSFLRIIVEKARELGEDISSLNKAVVSGEALPPSLRDELIDYGIDVLQCYASADLGLIAYESSAREGLIVDEGVIVELLTPGTADPVATGDVGEVVVTTLNPDYPLIRFATGDLSAHLPGESPCGRTGMRIKGWLGRADQTTKVRGMFVHPSMVAEIAKRHPQLKRARLVVSNPDHTDRMLLRCESAAVGEARESMHKSLQVAIRDITKLRGEVELVKPGALPNDGKVIDDVRTYT